MYSKKKSIIAGVLIFFMVVLGAVLMQKIYQNRLNEKDQEIATMQEKLDRIGDMAIAYRVITQVKGGTDCKSEELEAIEIPYECVGENGVFDLEDIKGMKYKLNLTPGTLLTSDMLSEFVLKDDMRYMDVVFDEIPIALEVGDYIDVRIAFPLGQDFIALSHKQVAKINGSTVKLIVGQKDFYSYESMKTDIATYRSTKVYGAQYVEAGMQAAAETYYPVNLEVMLTMLKDPNIQTSDYKQVLSLRQELEEQLLNNDRVEMAVTVTAGREAISEKFKNAQQEYARLQSQKEREEQLNKNNQTDTNTNGE